MSILYLLQACKADLEELVYELDLEIPKSSTVAELVKIIVNDVNYDPEMCENILWNIQEEHLEKWKLRTMKLKTQALEDVIISARRIEPEVAKPPSLEFLSTNLKDESGKSTQDGGQMKTKQCHVDEKEANITEDGAFPRPNAETALDEEGLTSVYSCEEGGAIHPAQEHVTAYPDNEFLNDCCHIRKLNELKAGKISKTKDKLQTCNQKHIMKCQEVSTVVVGVRKRKLEFDTRKYQQWKLQCDRASRSVSKIASHFKIFSKRRMKRRKVKFK